MSAISFRDLANHFYSLDAKQIPDLTKRQIKRSLLNYLAGSIFTAANQSSAKMVDFIKTIDSGNGQAFIWGDDQAFSTLVSAFANAARVSGIELNDSTQASAHPGIYVWSAVFAAMTETEVSVNDILRAVVFGYEVSTRMAIMSIDRIRELGLHNPGIVGGLGALATAGLMKKSTVDELVYAFGIATSLLPFAPFVSFVEGSDSKDFYGGWGAYLGLFSLKAAEHGLSGPEGVITGIKSLSTVFDSSKEEQHEIGNPYYIDNLSIKEYPACFAVNPPVNALKLIMQEHDFELEQIETIKVHSYKYSVDLSNGVGEKLNEISARLSTPYTIAYTLVHKDLHPDAFLPENINDEDLQDLAHRVELSVNADYGDGQQGVRGSQVTLVLNDGSEYSAEYDSVNKIIYSDEMLVEKVHAVMKPVIGEENSQKIINWVMRLEEQSSLKELVDIVQNSLK